MNRWFEAPGGYFSLPRALRYDDRLSHPDIHVLIAIASYVFLKDEVFPSRTSLKNCTGISEENISKRTSRLAKFGWLSKSGLPGHRMTYNLTIPEYAISKIKEAAHQNGVGTVRESVANLNEPKRTVFPNASQVRNVDTPHNRTEHNAEDDMGERDDLA